ncbi:hypothetical protein C5S39_08365, partial [Candidatus Methanophagaceae archaeon]
MNPETKAQEWHKPLKYLEYDYSDAMFELTLADGSELLVSPGHKVYGLILNQSSIFGSISQGFSNHPSIQAGILIQNLFDRHTSSKQLNNIANQYPGSFKDRLSMA